MKDLSQYSDAELEAIASSASYSDADLESIARSGAPSASAEIMAKHKKNIAAGAKAYKPSWPEAFETGYKQGGSSGMGAAMGLANVVGEAAKGAGEAVLNTSQRIGSAIQAGKEFFDPAAYKGIADNPIVDLPSKLVKGVTEPLISPRTTGEALGGAAIDSALISGPGAVAGEVAPRLYRSVLKPSLVKGETKAASSAARGLEEGVVINRAGTGVSKAQKITDDLNAEINQTISQIGPGKTGDPLDIALRAGPETKKLEKFQGASKATDQKIIDNTIDTFLEGHTQQMSPAELQILKKGTYQSNKKAYGQVPEAAAATEKTIARLAKEKLEEFAPNLKQLNAKDAELIGLNKDLKRAVSRISNSPVYSQARVYMAMAGGAAGAAAGGVTGGLAGALGLLAVKLAMDSPGFQSRLAIAMNRVGKYSPPASVPITAGIIGEQNGPD